MNRFSPIAIAIAALALIAAATGGIAVGQARSRHAQAQHTLDAIATLATEHEAQWAALRAAPFTEGGSDPLEVMLTRLRRDGVAKNAVMKQRLDVLTANTTALAALLDVYVPDARTAAFKSEARHFGEHAILWRDRWNSLLELFMAGGNYPAAEAAPPPGLAAAVAAEQQAAR